MQCSFLTSTSSEVAILDVDDVLRQPRVEAKAECAMLNVLVSNLVHIEGCSVYL